MQRTPVEMRQEVERQLDAGARRIAARDGLDFHLAYSRFLTTAHGGELYRLYNELPAGALPQPEAEPVRFAESVGAAQAWDEIDRLARERRATEPRLSIEAARVKILNERPGLYQRYLAEGGR